MPVGYECYTEFPLPEIRQIWGESVGPVLPMREHYIIIRMVMKKERWTTYGTT